MEKSSRKLATRKLNVIGNLTGHSSVITSDENLRRAQEDCRLASTYEEINERQKQFKDMEIVQKKNEIKLATDSGISKLRSNGCDFDRLTKIQLAGILLSIFNMYEDPEKNPKPKLLKLLRDTLQDQGDKFETLTEISLPIEENYIIPDIQDPTEEV